MRNSAPKSALKIISRCSSICIIFTNGSDSLQHSGRLRSAMTSPPNRATLPPPTTSGCKRRAQHPWQVSTPQLFSHQSSHAQPIAADTMLLRPDPVQRGLLGLASLDSCPSPLGSVCRALTGDHHMGTAPLKRSRYDISSLGPYSDFASSYYDFSSST